MPTKAEKEKEYGPWCPGLNSTIPTHLMDRVTLYDPAHSFTSWEEVRDLADLTGLRAEELAVIRPERLALHSVLIRVTSSLYVPDGPQYADLGINLRNMALRILNVYVAKQLDDVRAAYAGVKTEAETEVARLLDTEIFKSAPSAPEIRGGFFSKLFGKGDHQPQSAPDPLSAALAFAHTHKDASNETVATASRRALARTLGAIISRRGALIADRALITKVSVGLVLNRLGSAAVGRVVEEIFDSAARAEGFHRLPSQSQPVILNAKGASASGKSTIRSAQRSIAERLGLDWRDFAIISPDYWRKALLDYASLGVDYKYAAMLTGYELEIIDRKLDILMAVKGAGGQVPHMLIDRFRFDSFEIGKTRRQDSRLLTRFGAQIYLFFMITPPEETVLRAWHRGIETGRYKAVDDLLFHNIEAYSGMADLFFSWATAEDRAVHFEFLDNMVPRGARPKTVAFGRNGHLFVADLQKIADIERYKHVNIEARAPDEVRSSVLSTHKALSFARKCVRELPAVDFLVPGSNRIFAQARSGRLEIDLDALPRGLEPETLGAFTPSQRPLGALDPDHSAETIGTPVWG